MKAGAWPRDSAGARSTRAPVPVHVLRPRFRPRPPRPCGPLGSPRPNPRPRPSAGAGRQGALSGRTAHLAPGRRASAARRPGTFLLALSPPSPPAQRPPPALPARRGPHFPAALRRQQARRCAARAWSLRPGRRPRPRLRSEGEARSEARPGAVTICSDFGAQENKVWHCFHCFSIYLPWSEGQHIKSRDITLLIKVLLVKVIVFPVVVNGCESWTIQKA